jgi:hypothetical protein
MLGWRGMYPKLEMAKRRELALADWVWISGALIFVALMCFCILFFVKGANDLSATQIESLLRTPAPVAVIQAGPEPNPEVRNQPATAVTPAETQSRSSEVLSESAQHILNGGGATYEPATTNPTGAEVMLWNTSNSPMRRFSSHRRAALYKRAPRGIKGVIEMWFRALTAKSHR